MITEIVTFPLPKDMTRAKVIALFETTVPRWKANPDLVRKYYLYDDDAGVGGGVYLWPNIEAAKAAHDEAWCDKAETLYGARPSFQYFETPLMVDNST